MMGMRLVMKFGGTSIGDAKRISDVCKIISGRKGDEVVVVVSALAGVTDMLVNIAEQVSEGKISEEEIKDFIGELLEKHRVVAREVLRENK